MLKVNNNTAYTSPNFKGLTIGPNASKVLDKIGALKSPGQRLAFGVAALALHPVMDKLNPWVDEETKNTSAIRSAAKAIASTTTGVIIREACIVGTNALLNGKTFASKLPEFITKDKSHSSAVVGTLAGLGIMIFTNFLIDVPLTDKLTHLFTKVFGKKDANKGEPKAPAPAFTPAYAPASAPALAQVSKAVPSDTFSRSEKIQLHTIKEKIDKGELPPMSQVNMEVIKCAS